MRIKPIYIVALVGIAIAAGIIVSTAGDASTYVDFYQAKELALEGSSKKIHVVGELPKNNANFIYNPLVDPNYFEFTLIDDKGKPSRVIYRQPKPQDFEKSEKVVVVGRMEGEVFLADNILMKCPSKYQETEL